VNSYPFVKGHGTENDFVLLPDHDGSIHGKLEADRVAALCDRRAGIGGDGVMRVIRTAALLEVDPSVAALVSTGSTTEGGSTTDEQPEWFMDYRNSDGSLSEMCGNGVRVFGRHLADAGLIDTTVPVPIGTRAGVKVLTFDDERITVDMGEPRIGNPSIVEVGERGWPATDVDMGNPHAVAFVDSLDDAGPLVDEPAYDSGAYPHGVNIEFVVHRGERHVAMRVHERGSGETRSCGTGACAVMVASALLDGACDTAGPAADLTYRVDVPGGTLEVTWTAAGRILLTGPAVLVAEGTSAL
jgi:diaminopimelate epimerase